MSVVTVVCALGLVASGRAGPRWWRAAAVPLIKPVPLGDSH